MVSVFLGGTCNGSTWREELMALLDSEKVSAFNPVVPNWDEEAQRVEDYHKENDDYCLYVLTPEMKGIYSIFELASDSIKRPGRVIFCLIPSRDGKEFDPFVLKNFAKIKKDLVHNGTIVCDSLKQVAIFLNNAETLTNDANLKLNKIKRP